MWRRSRQKVRFQSFFLALLEREAQEQNRSGNSANRPKAQLPRTKCLAHTLNCPRFLWTPASFRRGGGQKRKNLRFSFGTERWGVQVRRSGEHLPRQSIELLHDLPMEARTFHHLFKTKVTWSLTFPVKGSKQRNDGDYF